jgi:DNA polymerase-3 subunit delta
MAAPTVNVSDSLALIWGEDEYSVKNRARQLFEEWKAGGADAEIIDGSVANSGEALRSIARLREALQTLPFFGTGKVVWWRQLNFLGEERTAATKAVTDALAELGRELAAFSWRNVRLIISAGKVDRVRSFYKTLDKVARVEGFTELTTEDRDWVHKAETFALKEFKTLAKEIETEALDQFIAWVGPNTRQLRSEVEKLVLYAADRPSICLGDIEAIVTRQKQSQAFALAEALGDRRLPQLLKTLDEALWEMKSDSQKSAIGILYGLISKVRILIFLKEMTRLGLLKPTPNLTSFRDQLGNLPGDILPADKRFNPLSMHPYMLFKAMPQIRNYSMVELIQAMERLLECNRRLISSSTDETVVLQQTLIAIASKES